MQKSFKNFKLFKDKSNLPQTKPTLKHHVQPTLADIDPVLPAPINVPIDQSISMDISIGNTSHGVISPIANIFRNYGNFDNNLSLDDAFDQAFDFEQYQSSPKSKRLFDAGDPVFDNSIIEFIAAGKKIVVDESTDESVVIPLGRKKQVIHEDDESLIIPAADDEKSLDLMQLMQVESQDKENVYPGRKKITKKSKEVSINAANVAKKKAIVIESGESDLMQVESQDKENAYPGRKKVTKKSKEVSIIAAKKQATVIESGDESLDLMQVESQDNLEKENGYTGRKKITKKSKEVSINAGNVAKKVKKQAVVIESSESDLMQVENSLNQETIETNESEKSFTSLKTTSKSILKRVSKDRVYPNPKTKINSGVVNPSKKRVSFEDDQEIKQIDDENVSDCESDIIGKDGGSFVECKFRVITLENELPHTLGWDELR